MAIKGLPGFMWVYKGQPNPATGEIAKARYAFNPVTDERLTLRNAQARVRGGRYEELVPQEQRKKYKPRSKPRKSKKGDYDIFGPYKSIADLKSAVKDKVGPNDKVLLQVRGKYNKGARKKGKKYTGNKYATVTTSQTWQQLQGELDRIQNKGPWTNLFQRRVDDNLSDFERIDKYYLWRKG